MKEIGNNFSSLESLKKIVLSEKEKIIVENKKANSLMKKQIIIEELER